MAELGLIYSYFKIPYSKFLFSLTTPLRYHHHPIQHHHHHHHPAILHTYPIAYNYLKLLNKLWYLPQFSKCVHAGNIHMILTLPRCTPKNIWSPAAQTAQAGIKIYFNLLLGQRTLIMELVKWRGGCWEN